MIVRIVIVRIVTVQIVKVLIVIVQIVTVLIKVSQTNKWSWDQAIDLPNYVVHVYQSIYENN